MAVSKRISPGSPARRPPSRLHRPASRALKRRSRRGLVARWLLGLAAGLLAILLWAVLVRSTAPRSNTNRQTFDAILILGTPADSDGNPTPELLDRISEGVREYEHGVAPRLIVSGAAAHNRFIEADVMSRVAQAQGVPASSIIEEPKAMDTIQNVCYSTAIMREHGWHSVEVVSAASHLPRAALILQNQSGPKLEWRIHAAQDQLTPGYYSKGAILFETLKTARYLIWTRWTERCG